MADLDQQFEDMKTDRRKISSIKRRLDKISGEATRLASELTELTDKYDKPAASN